MTDGWADDAVLRETLTILQQAGELGLVAKEVFEQSVISESLMATTGALNRLRNQKKVCRGTDKRWRTMNQAERGREQRAERVQAAAQAVAAERAKPVPAPKPSNDKPKPAARPEPYQSVLKPDPEPPAPQQPAPRRDISPAAALDAVARVAKRDQERRQAQHQADANLEWLIRDLDEEADAAQVRLDRYVNQLGDEILEHLVEMALAANRALEAARSRA